MSRNLWAALVVVALLASAVPAFSFPENLLSGKLGARVLTTAKVAEGQDPNRILSDEPVSKGEFSFADVPQRNIFTVDLGHARVFDRIQFGSDNEGQWRSPKRLTIAISEKGANGPYKVIGVKSPVAWFQIVRIPRVKARWVRLDLGDRTIGAVVRSVRIYKGYEHPRLVEVTKLLHERIKPGIPGLKKFYAEADAGKWPAACKALRAYFLAAHVEEGKPDPKWDLTRAKNYVNGELDFAGMKRHEVAPIDWSYQKTTDWYEHKNFLNRGSILYYPCQAYYNTGNKYWADQFRKILYDWIDANPRPTLMSKQDYPPWRTLDSAARLGALQICLMRAAVGKNIEDELWANLLLSVWEHCDFLKNDNFTGGNWLAINSAAVMSAALQLPEFKEQTTWLAFGKTSFETNVLRDVYPDGKEKEDAPGYVAFAYSGMLGTLQSLDKAGIEVSAEARRRMDRAQDFLGAVTSPDGSAPAIGDFNGGDMYSLNSSWKYFKREDIRYILTKGKEGVAPSFASINFPDGGWSIMRSSYDEKPYENARHLVFKSSSGSHGHLDIFNVCAYAYGRPLLIDPGIRSYEGADVDRYLRTSYHNTLCVDGTNQSRGGGKTDLWKSDDTADYVYGTHQAYKGLTVRRAVVFVKPDYWIVHDDVLGDGSHTYDQNWHFPVSANPTEDPATKAVHTTFPTGGNVLLVPADIDGLKSEVTDFLITSESLNAGASNVPAKGWKYAREGNAPQSWDVVLYPYQGTTPPNVSVKRLLVKDADNTQVTALEITIDGKKDTVMFSRVGARDMSAVNSDGSPLTGSGDIVAIRGSK